MDFLIHWPPGPVVATVECQGLPLLPLSFNAGGGLSPWAFAIDKRNMIAISILEVGANDRIV